MKHFGFHENRYQFAKFIGVIFVLLSVYFKRETLDIILQIPHLNHSFARTNITNSVGNSIDIAHDRKLAWEIVRHTTKYNKPLIIYQRPPILPQGISFCGATVGLTLEEGSLKDIDKPEGTMSRMRRFTVRSGDMQHKVIHPILLDEITRAYKNDVIYSCKNLKLSNIRNMQDMKLEDIICQKLTVDTISPFFAPKPFKIIYLKPGSAPRLRCGDKVNIQYQIKSTSHQLLYTDVALDVIIGHGTMPIQMEQALLLIGKGGYIVIDIKNTSLPNVSFYGIENKTLKTLPNLHYPNGNLLIKIRALE